MMMDLDIFFQEKKLPNTKWLIEHKGKMHEIDSDTVIAYILETSEFRRCMHVANLFSIHFRGDDLMKYLYYVGVDMIRQTEREKTCT